jgi:hypothetical protein
MKILFFALWVLVQGLPFKPNEEFEIKLDLKFKQRPSFDNTRTVDLDETRAEYDKRTSTTPLPYLILNVKFLKLNNETRIRITNNLDSKSANRKVTEGMIVPIDMGFTPDIKDRINPHHYTITFLSPEKSEVSRIEIFVEEDGTFLVNSEKRGKF